MSKRGRVLAVASAIALIVAAVGFVYVAKSRTSAAASRDSSEKSDLASRASAGDADADRAVVDGEVRERRTDASEEDAVDDRRPPYVGAGSCGAAR